MPVDIIMRRAGPVRLAPETGYDLELLEQLPQDKPLRCHITVARSDNHQRWYWKMLSKVVENTDMFRTSDALHLFLKIRTGFVDHIKIHTGETVIIPESTSYGAMDQTRFKQYTDAAIEVICADVLPGVTVDEIME